MVDCTGDLDESAGLVSLVCREVVRLLGDVGTGLFTRCSEPCLAPFVLLFLSSRFKGLRPFVDGERARTVFLTALLLLLSSSRSALIAFFAGDSMMVSASDSFSPAPSSELVSPLCTRPFVGCFSPYVEEDAFSDEAVGSGGELWWALCWRSLRAPAETEEGFRTGAALLVITQDRDRH